MKKTIFSTTLFLSVFILASSDAFAAPHPQTQTHRHDQTTHVRPISQPMRPVVRYQTQPRRHRPVQVIHHYHPRPSHVTYYRSSGCDHASSAVIGFLGGAMLVAALTH